MSDLPFHDSCLMRADQPCARRGQPCATHTEPAFRDCWCGDRELTDPALCPRHGSEAGLPDSACNCDARAKASGYHMVGCPLYPQWVASYGGFRDGPALENKNGITDTESDLCDGCNGEGRVQMQHGGWFPCPECSEESLPVAERIIHAADERALEAFNRRAGELRGVSSTGLPEDNERSDLLREGFRYGVDHGRAMGSESPLVSCPSCDGWKAKADHRNGMASEARRREKEWRNNFQRQLDLKRKAEADRDRLAATVEATEKLVALGEDVPKLRAERDTFRDLAERQSVGLERYRDALRDLLHQYEVTNGTCKDEGCPDDCAAKRAREALNA